MVIKAYFIVSIFEASLLILQKFLFMGFVYGLINCVIFQYFKSAPYLLLYKLLLPA